MGMVNSQSCSNYSNDETRYFVSVKLQLKEKGGFLFSKTVKPPLSFDDFRIHKKVNTVFEEQSPIIFT